MEFLSELHPLIVHFPVTLFVLYVLFEITAAVSRKELFIKISPVILSIGILAAVASVLTGNQAYETGKSIFSFNHEFPDGIARMHENYATATLMYFLILLIFRIYIVIKKKLSRTFLIIFSVLGLTGCYFLYLTGLYGAELVYKYGVGIKL